MNLSARIAATFNRSGAARDNLVGAAAMPVVSRGSRGTSAPAARRAPIALIAALATVAGLAFTAAPALAAPPTVTPPVVSDVSYSSAHVTSEVTGDFVSYSFEVSTNGTDWTANTGGFYFGKETLNANLSGLQDGTQYFVRLSANNFGDPVVTSPGPNPSFTTLVADPPSVETADNASEISYTTAEVSGKVNRPEKSDDLTCNFEYITDAQFTANQGASNPGFEGATPVPCETDPPTTPGVISAPGSNSVQAELTGLTNNTNYHLRLAVSGAGGKDAKEAAATFTTLTVDPPTVVSVDDAGDVFSRSANASGVIKRPANPDPAFDITSCRFEYVADAQFGTTGFDGAGTADCVEPIDNAPDAETNVSAALSGLEPSTTYHLRLAAGNAAAAAGTKEAASTFITTAKVAKPSVLSIQNATGVDQDSAKVKGEVQRPAGEDPALDVNCRFEYVTDEQFKATSFDGAGQAPCVENPITSSGPAFPAVSAPVEAQILGLTPETTYHLRLAVENGGGIDTKDAATFTTTADLPAAAVVGDITEVSYATATVAGEVDAGDAGFVQPTVEISTDGVTDWIRAGRGADIFGGNKLAPFSPIPITGLRGGTKYFVRINVLDCSSGGCGFGGSEGAPTVVLSQPPHPSFETLPVQAPTVLKVNDATDVGNETAKVSGEIERPANPDPAFDTNCRFEYVTDAKFDATSFQGADQTPCGIASLATPEEKKAVEAELTDLKAGTEYHLRLTATNAGPDASLEANPFTTTTILATIKATPGGSDGQGGYVLEGLVNPNNSTLSGCKFVYGPTSEADPEKYAFAVPCSPLPEAVNKPVTVEGHVTGLTAGAEYHSRLVVTNLAGTAMTVDQIFVPTLSPPDNCSNEQLRKENSSLALPECRAYEKVTPSGKEGSLATLADFSGGERVAFQSGAGNIAKSGQNALIGNTYVAARTSAGWETIPNLNGSSGSIYDAPTFALGTAERPRYSLDLLSSLWKFDRKGELSQNNFQLRGPDGTFTLVGSADYPAGPGALKIGSSLSSDDLSHLIVGLSNVSFGATNWGPGVYEFVGTGVDQPRRVDVDNSGAPVSTCPVANDQTALARAISADGRTIVFQVGGGAGCAPPNPPATEIWARVGGTVSIDVSASQCNRVDCNAPANPTFQGAATDGSRVFFITTQQLLDSDVDQTSDIYACDIPAGTPAPIGKSNSCAALRQVSNGDPTGAGFESFLTTSDDGASVAFTAKAVLADNEDALKEKALDGDHNLYIWRTDAAHPAGQTSFIGRLDSNDIAGAQTTPDGRYLVFATASQLVETDTDSARDVYRFDVDNGKLTRVSTNVFGTAGNGDPNAAVPADDAVSDDGQRVVFTTTEALSPADGNAEPDVYLWTPDRVSLITSGSVGGAVAFAVDSIPVSIDGSGQDIYFQTPGALTPDDGDDLADVYDARIDGGFSFAPKPICTGEDCQPKSEVKPREPKPVTSQPPPDGGNVKLKTCPKGKVLKGKRCVKKNKKHHGKKKSHKKNKRTASHGRRGDK